MKDLLSFYPPLSQMNKTTGNDIGTSIINETTDIAPGNITNFKDGLANTITFTKTNPMPLLETLQQILDKSGFTQYTNKDVVNSAPRLKVKKGTKIEFFKLNKYYSDDELEKEYESHGLVAVDPYMLAEQIEDFIEEKKYLLTHWKDKEGKWCYATFSGWDDERNVYVDRGGNYCYGVWWVGGVRKSALINSDTQNSSDTLAL